MSGSRIKRRPGSAGTELQYLAPDALDRLLIFEIVQYIRYPARELTGFFNAEAASRYGWRAETQAAGDKRRLRVIGNRVLVHRDVGAAQSRIGRFAGNASLIRLTSIR